MRLCHVQHMTCAIHDQAVRRAVRSNLWQNCEIIDSPCFLKMSATLTILRNYPTTQPYSSMFHNLGGFLWGDITFPEEEIARSLQ